jgi:hypothetical protein
MKKINLAKAKKDLHNLKADNTSFELIVNNIQQYNDLIDKYNDNTIGRDIYLLYQLNGLVVKQISELKKQNKKSTEEEDTFTDLIESMKKK